LLLVSFCHCNSNTNFEIPIQEISFAKEIGNSQSMDASVFATAEASLLHILNRKITEIEE
jgi:hypothetical protein